MPVVRRNAFALGWVMLVGCYEMQPADYTAATPGTEMAFDITDVGRVGLGGAMGPEIGQIEGRIVDADSTSYLVAVTDVHFLRGGEQVWTGEKVKLQKTYVSRLYEKRYSRGRTIFASALGLGAVALLASQTILGNGSVGKELPPDTSATKIRLPRP